MTPLVISLACDIMGWVAVNMLPGAETNIILPTCNPSVQEPETESTRQPGLQGRPSLKTITATKWAY